MIFGGKKDKDVKKSENGLNRNFWQAMNASSAGLVFFLSIAIGGVIGYYLDKFFGTKPYLLLFFLVMGIIAGFRNLWLFVERSRKSGEDEDEKKDGKK